MNKLFSLKQGLVEIKVFLQFIVTVYTVYPFPQT